MSMTMTPPQYPQQPVMQQPSGPKPPAPKTRRKAMFFDRAKLLVIVAVFLGFLIAKQHADYPFESWWTAARTQLAAKQWLLWLCGLEVLRQIHYLWSENSASYNHFWTYRIWGGWDRFWSRRKPWLRYRLARAFRVSAWIAIFMAIFAAVWRVPYFEAFSQAPTRLWKALFSQDQGMPFIFQMIMYIGFGILQFVAIFWFMSRGGTDTYLPDEVETRFADVWGQDRVLEKVRENIVFLEKPAEIEAKGGHVPSGILLWGPPGTGKTLIAKAVAGETGRPYVFVDPGAFQNMFMGVGILKVKGLFKKLRKLALRHGGVIVFFDEADSLGNRGTAVAGRRKNAKHEAATQASTAYASTCNGMHYAGSRTAEFLHAMRADHDSQDRQVVVTPGGGGGMGTLQALLTEISGLDKPRGMVSRQLRKFLGMPAKQPPKYRILIMMATNAPDVLDPALLRPGRLDRKYQVGYPSLDGRKDTYRNYLRKITHEITEEQIERVALMHPRASGAEIKDIVNEALIVAMRENRQVVTWKDLLHAKGFKTHGMPDEVHPMALERHAVALHEASHAIAMKRLKKRETIDVATIEPRGPVGGFVAPVPLEEPGFDWKNSFEEEVMTFLASLAGERLFFDGDNSVGVGGDMNASTAMVSQMIGFAAMGDTLASHGVLFATDSDSARTVFNTQVEAKLQELYKRTQTLIAENRRWVMAIAHALEKYKTISGEDIDAILNGTKGPTVDGTWYHTDSFVMAYERFHQVALAAHKNQTKLMAPLPTPENIFILETNPMPMPTYQQQPFGTLPPAGGTSGPSFPAPPPSGPQNPWGPPQGSPSWPRG